MTDEKSDSLEAGLKGLGDHIGSGLAWMGFWIFLGLLSMDITQVL